MRNKDTSLFNINPAKSVVWVLKGLVGIMVLNVTFNNISVISWRSVLLEEETCREYKTFPAKNI
jgi:hypothetical protein